MNAPRASRNKHCVDTPSIMRLRNYFVVLPFSSLARLKRSCCALYLLHCASSSLRRRSARLLSQNLLVGIGGGSFRRTASLGPTLTVITASTTAMMGQTTSNTFTYEGILPPPNARSRASRLISGDRSHPQLGQHSKKLGIIASQPKHFSSVASSDIETSQENQCHVDYAACRFSYPQRGQASKKLGIGMRHSAQSFSPGSRLHFRCAYGSEPQFAQGSSNFPVLILAPQQVQNVPAEYIPIDHPPKKCSFIIYRQTKQHLLIA